MTTDMKIVDVPRYDHFDKADDLYPDNATYLLYGDVGNAYLFHTPTKDPDYLQVGSMCAWEFRPACSLVMQGNLEFETLYNFPNRR